MRSKALHATILGVLLGLFGCGGGGGSGSDSGDGSDGGNVEEGQFVDSPVEGLTYETSTQSGKTDEAGTFKYKEGETVGFALGEMYLGAFSGNELITPNEIAGGAATDRQSLINLLRLLQSLDADRDLANGIRLAEGVDSLTGELDLSSEASVSDALRTVDDSRSLVSASQAWNHFMESLDKLDLPDPGKEYLTLLSSNLDDSASCPDWSDADFSTKILENGDVRYEGSLKTRGGGEDNFSITGGKRDASGNTDSGNSVYIRRDVTFDPGGVLLTVGTAITGDSTRRNPPCGTLFRMKTKGADVRPPVADLIHSRVRQEICDRGQESYYTLVRDWTVRSPNHYFTERPKLTYSVEGGSTSEDASVVHENRSPANGSKFWYWSGDFGFEAPCGKDMEYTVTAVDAAGNEVTTEGSKSFDGSDDSTGSGSTEEWEYCAENYSGQHCDTLLELEDNEFDRLYGDPVVLLESSEFSGTVEGGFCSGEFGLIPETSADAVVEDYSGRSDVQLNLPDGSTYTPTANSSYFAEQDRVSCYICTKPESECAN